MALGYRLLNFKQVQEGSCCHSQRPQLEIVGLETSAQWMCVFQLGNSRAIHIMLEKNVFWLICLLLGTQANKIELL